jgi:hypothetical protein
MSKRTATILRALAISAACSAPALALDNPVLVDLQAEHGAQPAGTATIFGSGSTVLVNVTAKATAPNGAAVTLNEGNCSHPGSVAFALSGLSDRQSLTQLKHPLDDVAQKAKSMVIHQTSSETSPAFACGAISS